VSIVERREHRSPAGVDHRGARRHLPGLLDGADECDPIAFRDDGFGRLRGDNAPDHYPNLILDRRHAAMLAGRPADRLAREGVEGSAYGTPLSVPYEPNTSTSATRTVRSWTLPAEQSVTFLGSSSWSPW
jgi:hypothetical protein